MEPGGGGGRRALESVRTAPLGSWAEEPWALSSDRASQVSVTVPGGPQSLDIAWLQSSTFGSCCRGGRRFLLPHPSPHGLQGAWSSCGDM